MLQSKSQLSSSSSSSLLAQVICWLTLLEVMDSFHFCVLAFATNNKIVVDAPPFTRFCSSRLLLSSLPSESSATISAMSNTVRGDDDDQPQEEEEEHHFHEFWRKQRSHQEVQFHIEDCLAAAQCTTTTTSTPATATQLPPHVHVVSAEPPLVVIHDFLSQQACQDVIQAAKHTGDMAPSTTGPTQNTSKSRTSSTV